MRRIIITVFALLLLLCECSGIAVDLDSGTVYMCSWVDGGTSDYLYAYDLNTGDYKGKIQMDPVPKWIQGVAYFDGALYVTCDDGDTDKDEPDNMYKLEISGDMAKVTPERAFTDVTRQGEIEGLSFDRQNGQVLLLYNRGARIILGMPSGFYEGYTEEIHEVFVYNMK